MIDETNSGDINFSSGESLGFSADDMEVEEESFDLELNGPAEG